MRDSIKQRRPLGNGEFYFWQMDPHYCMNFSIYAKIGGKLEPNRVKQALKNLQQEYVPLRSYIQVNEDVFLAESTHPAAIELKVVASENLASHQILMSEIHRRFRTKADGLARCVCIRKNESEYVLALILAHVISDGRSAVSLFRRFITLLGGADVGDSVAASVPFESRLSKYLIKRGGVKGIRKNFLADQLKIKSCPRAYGFPGQLDKVFDPQTIGIIPMSLQGDCLAKIMPLCRQNKTTLQGLFGALLLASIHSVFALDSQVELTLNAPCDLRPDLDLDEEHSNLFLAIGGLKFQHLVSSGDFNWSLAAAYTRSLQKTFAGGTAHLSYDLMYDLLFERSVKPENSHKFLEYMASHQVAGTITNWGAFDKISQVADLEIRELNFLVPPVPFSLVTLGAITSYNQLNVHLTYVKSQLTADHASQILAEFQNKFNDLVALSTSICTDDSKNN